MATIKIDDSLKGPDTASDPKKVFVVYGRNEEALKALSAFLRSIDLHPVLWKDAVALTKKRCSVRRRSAYSWLQGRPTASRSRSAYRRRLRAYWEAFRHRRFDPAS